MWGDALAYDAESAMMWGDAYDASYYEASTMRGDAYAMMRGDVYDASYYVASMMWGDALTYDAESSMMWGEAYDASYFENLWCEVMP